MKQLPLKYYLEAVEELGFPVEIRHQMAKKAAELHVSSVEFTSTLSGPMLLKAAYIAAENQIRDSLGIPRESKES